jgi:hypothetical protein
MRVIGLPTTAPRAPPAALTQPVPAAGEREANPEKLLGVDAAVGEHVGVDHFGR